ncbi:hypothetical protein FANTH_3564 [Fusarium anthophilum]|uniref:SET domain-containing protein n=1 Tax=Fusarium anthophilum TaxID=48485 RepID=A0A8H5E916_9HYPO|nr:hypothetical protein FANTH_3564 [Fusarium anthophilum]
MRLARLYLGPRVQPWNDGLNQFGYYSWSEVYDSFRLYNQPRSPSSIIMPPFEVRDIPGKGRGLIAKIDIPAGARILWEKPLLLANPIASEDLEATVAAKVKALSKSQQQQFLSLHNNFPGHETIRAIRPIKAGEEITINYDEGGPSNVRRPMLKKSFGFDCACSLCTLPPSQLQASDDRRVRIQQLDASIRDSLATAIDPKGSLKSCLSLLYTLEEEYGACSVQHSARVYYYAFQICIAHGDVDRATTFAERSYRAKVICGGEDNVETLRLKTLVLQPTTHSSYGALSMRWKTDREESFSGYNTVEFEKWLFRQ